MNMEQALERVANKERSLPGLTVQQNKLLAFLSEREAAGEPSPTFDEMKDALGLASKSGIDRLIRGLEERGYIERRPNRARAVMIKAPEAIDRVPTAVLARELRERGWRVTL